MERDHVGTIAERFIRPRVRLQEESIAPGSDGRSSKIGDHAAVTAAGIASRGRHLYAVRGVKDHGPAEILHPGDGTHVAHQSTVSEGDASFGQEQSRVV